MSLYYHKWLRLTFLVCSIALTLYGCSGDPSKPSPTPDSANSQSLAAAGSHSSADTPIRPASQGSAVATRNLLEAGAKTQRHPSAKMKRPDKWQTQNLPAAEQILSDSARNLLPAKEFEKLESVGLSRPVLYRTEESPDEAIARLVSLAPQAKVEQEDGSLSVRVPVKEGLVVVIATRKGQNTQVFQMLMKNDQIPLKLPHGLNETGRE